MARYLITGGTGFIGEYYISSLPEEDSVIILSRNAKKPSGKISTVTSLEDIDKNESIDVIINLAGSPIDRRWAGKVKKDLIHSRLSVTTSIVKLIERLNNKPKLLISASAIGYYGGHNLEKLDEQSQVKPSFTNNLCSLWEEEAKKARTYGVRTCIMRLGVVLGKGKGFIGKIYWPFNLGVGGCVGDGQQYMPWIHIGDVVKAIKFLILHEACDGIYNFTAPNTPTNYQITKEIGKILHRPTILTIPKFMVKLIFGEMGQELLLKGNIIQPNKLLSEGFSFDYENVNNALEDILSEGS